MADSNVFVEVFTSVLSERLVPIATKEEVVKALEEVSRANDLYVVDSQLKVPEAWLSAMTVDFGDWLCDHIPLATEADICRDFYDISIIAQYQMYSAGERVNGLQSLISSRGGCSQEVDMVARGFADTLSSITDAVSITYVCGAEEVDTFYIPACEPSEVVDQTCVDGPACKSITPRVMGWRECHAAAIRCLTEGIGAMTICIHEPDAITLGALTLFENRGWIVPGEIMGELMMGFANQDENGMPLLANLSSFMPACDFENLARVFAACIISAGTETVDIAHKDMMQRKLDGFKIFSINPFNTAVDFEGHCTFHVVNENVAMSNLPTLFDAVIDMDPFLTGTDASESVMVAALTRAACEIIMEGDVEKIAEEVRDFVMFMELDSNNRAFDKYSLMLLTEYDEALAEQSVMTTMSAMYEDLERNRKSEIDAIVDAMAADPASFRSILAIEGDGQDHKTPARAHSTFMPPGLPSEGEEASKERLRSLCTQCMLSPRMTMFLVKRPMNSSPVLISGIDWDSGNWKDLGPDRTLEFLDGTNIGEILNVDPGEALDYQKIDKPSPN